MKFILAIIALYSLVACNQDTKHSTTAKMVAKADAPTTLVVNNVEHHRTINSILPPAGYNIAKSQEGSYAQYLQNIPLKPRGSKIKYYDGRVKSYFSEYAAVLDLPIGHKDLHQCADAVMRLRADYLWNTQQYEKIHFNFTNGMRVDYTNWMRGQRIKVEGNKTQWYQAKIASNTEEDYWNYLEQIWMYAGTLSLSKELKSRTIKDIQIGDVFIQGGTPGHAISVVNIATNATTGEKLILLAQSYMPAQEMHVLTNPNNDNLSPWYSSKNLTQLHTPEWTFAVEDLMFFEN